MFAGGSTALGCEVFLGEDILLRINVSQGESLAVGVAVIPPDSQVVDIEVVEVLATGALSAIRTRPVVEVISMPFATSSTGKVWSYDSFIL